MCDTDPIRGIRGPLKNTKHPAALGVSDFDLRKETDDNAGTKIHIVDDDPLLRETASHILRTAGFSTASYPSADEFLAQITTADSGCLLLDIRMPGTGGIDLLEHLAKVRAPFCVVVVTGHADVPSAVRAIKAGAVDIIEKPFTKALLLQGVAKAMNAAIARNRLIERTKHLSQLSRSLSAREQQILKLIVDGYSSKEAAQQLGISPRTVDNHRANIMRKMGVKRISALAYISHFLFQRN